MNRQQLLKQLDKAWTAFKESYAGLSESQLTQPGVTGHWSVKDIVAHVTWWEEEALQHLPRILTGGRPPRYSIKYGGIDAFNAQMTEQKRGLSLSDVLRQQEGTHRQLIDYVQSAPEEQFTRETRFRRRLRLDTYSHYPKHAKAIRAWRARSAGEGQFRTDA
jgi:DinB superfamily